MIGGELSQLAFIELSTFQFVTGDREPVSTFEDDVEEGTAMLL